MLPRPPTAFVRPGYALPPPRGVTAASPHQPRDVCAGTVAHCCAVPAPTCAAITAAGADSGVDPTEVAERAGNSVEVLPSRYAKCIDGRQEIANRKIEELLREYE